VAIEAFPWYAIGTTNQISIPLPCSSEIDHKGEMAANSGGVEWAAIVKPILAASYGSLNKNDVLELVKAVNRR
jgi:hypothetical protein